MIRIFFLVFPATTLAPAEAGVGSFVSGLSRQNFLSRHALHGFLRSLRRRLRAACTICCTALHDRHRRERNQARHSRRGVDGPRLQPGRFMSSYPTMRGSCRARRNIRSLQRRASREGVAEQFDGLEASMRLSGAIEKRG